MINKLIYIILGALLVSCGSTESLKDEAYNAGWNSIWDERCRGITQPQVVPKKYDDSYEGGEVLSYYRNGISDAISNKNICESVRKIP
jgi:hypothetical protein